MMQQLFFMFIGLLISFLIGLANASEIIAPESIAGDIVTTRFEFGAEQTDLPTNFTVKVQIFDVKTCENSCENNLLSIDENETQDVALVVDFYSEECFACGYARLAEMAKEAGAKAFLFFSTEKAGHEALVIHSFEKAEEMRGFPAFELQGEDATLISEAAKTETVVVELSVDTNEWLEFYDGMWLYVRIVVATASGAAIIFGATRIKRFLPGFFKDGHFKVAVFTLSIEILNNFLRGLYCIVDPMWSTGSFNYGIGRFFLTVTIPLQLLTTATLCLAWADLLQRQVVKHSRSQFLSKSKQRLFIVITLALVSLDLSFSLLAAFKGLVNLSATFSIITGVVSILLAVALLIVGFRLIRILKNSQAYKSSSDTSNSGTTSGAMVAAGDSSGGSFNHVESQSYTQTQEETVDGGSSFHQTPTTPNLSTKFSSSGDLSRADSSNNLKTKRSRFKLTSRRKDRILVLNRKVMILAFLSILFAVVIVASGQNPSLFNPYPRGGLFLAYHLVGVAISVGKISFFARAS